MTRIRLTLGLVLAAQMSLAEENPNTAKGFNAKATYDFTGVEAVNAFNGSVTLSIPLGQTYAVGPRLSYKLGIVYTGNNWKYLKNEYQEWVATSDPGDEDGYEWVSRHRYYNEPAVCHGCGKPVFAGMGWRVAIGELLESANSYFAPDGSSHTFSDALHPGDAGGSDYTFYTNDSSYLRLRKFVNGYGEYQGAEIDFPDGSIHAFDTAGRLVEMRDGLPKNTVTNEYPNWVRYAYAGPTNGITTVTITDSIGRTQTLKYKRMSGVAGTFYTNESPYGNLGSTEDPASYDVLIEVNLTAFASSTPARYELTYVDGDGDPLTFDAAPISRKYFGSRQDCAVPSRVFVPLLKSVIQPDGTSYALTYDRGNLTSFSEPKGAPGVVTSTGVNFVVLRSNGSGYDSNTTVSFSGGGGTGAAATATVDGGSVTGITMTSFGSGYTSAPTVTINGTGSGATAVASVCARVGSFSGNVTRLQLPTGGAIDWEYAVWKFAADSALSYCKKGDYEANVACLEVAGEAEGVSTRFERDAGVAAGAVGDVMKKRTYATQHEGLTESSFHTQTTTIKDYKDFSATGAGGTVVSSVRNYFSAGTETSDDSTGTRQGEYGLPFTRYTSLYPRDPFSTEERPRYLSTRTYDGDADSGGVLKQATYVAYEVDPELVIADSSWNSRRRDESTVYHEDNTYVATLRDGFNGLGEYGTVTRISNIPSTPTRVSVTNFTSSASSPYDPSAPLPKWTPSAYDAATVTENDRAIKAEFCFDATTPYLLTRKRLLRDATSAATASSRGSADVIVAYAYDANGFAVSEAYHGGDEQAGETGVGTGALCSATLGTADYTISHSRSAFTSAGWTEQSQYSGGVELRDVTIDLNTGHVRYSRDSAEVQTEYQYDSMGRLIASKPTGRAWSVYTYPTASSRVLTVDQFAAGSVSGTALTNSSYTFDAFGRIVKESTVLPSNVVSSRHITYDQLGRRKTVSEAGALSGLPVTTFDYDSLGRVQSITGPDGAVTSFAYTGIAKKDREAGIWMGGTSDTRVKTTEQYDGYGRLVAVVEKSGPTSATVTTGAAVTTEYGYGPDDRLFSVTMKAPDGGPVQRRIFDYDGRGFLRWESQPEAGMTAYTYDARGHVLTKRHGEAKTHLDLNYAYDGAERLTRVDARSPDDPSAFRVLKSFTFGTANVGANLAAGKLIESVRYNYDLRNAEDNGVSPVYKVAHAYAYEDAAGRKTSRTTTITDVEYPDYQPLIKQVRIGMTYDDLDLPTNIAYPTCVDCGQPPTDPARALMAHSYDRGRLKSIAGFVPEITYWPNGMRNTLSHSNGIMDTQVTGAIPRPTEIKFETADRCTVPVVVTEPGNVTVEPSGNATLSVTVTGTPPFVYEWEGQLSDLSSRSSRVTTTSTTHSISVPHTDVGKYFVRVWNDCGRVESATATVSETCSVPHIYSITAAAQLDGSWLLTPDMTAAAGATYSWSVGPDGPQIGTGRTITVGAVTETTTYLLAVSDSCGTATGGVRIDMPIPPPSGLVATRVSGVNQIHLAWNGVAGAASYQVERRSGPSWEVLAASVTTTSYTDGGVASGRTYAYRVKADHSAYGASEIATTMTYQSAVAGASVDPGQLNSVLAAVNSARAAAGWPSVTWSSVLASTDPVPSPGAVITGRHITSCRARMNEALQALGVPVTEYTDPEVVLTTVKAVHINEVQGRTQ